MEDFKVHALAVGGGTLALSRLMGAGGHLANDLAILLDWSPQIVLTMVETPELAAHGAAGLDAKLGTAAWVHMPVPDFQTPNAQQDRDWPQLEAQMLKCLARGERILVHCMGGCGRSGMIVLRLMIAAGEAPDAALVRIRHLRPCAIETQAQLEWASRR